MSDEATALPSIDPGDPIRRCLATLGEAIQAAESLGVPVDVARVAHEDASSRLGFPSDAYVLALVGGTGVGKSSLLNALAGAAVSTASARRPTTSEPVAWIPSGEAPALEPLLGWLGVHDVRTHASGDLDRVAILDLPDMDSTAAEHRARVEAVLPRVDAVAWVTDLEKYADAALHDAFLRLWVPRLDRQAIIVNKVDRLANADRARVRRDLEVELDRRLGIGHDRVPVLMTSTLQDASDLDELRSWLADGVAAKAVVRARVAATATDLARALARDAGIDPSKPATPFLDDRQRESAIDGAANAALRAIDLPGLERQAIAATRARARARGAGPMGQVTSLAYRLSGRQMRVADPEGFLLRWRERAPLTPAVESLRVALAGPIGEASSAVRPRLAASLEPVALQQGLERSVDRALSGLERFEAPTSRWWTLLGALQTIATAGIALAAAWLVVWILAKPPVDPVRVPVLGLVPMPFALLVVTVVLGYVLARILGLHAGWLGRRWARRVRDRVAASVRGAVTEQGFAPLDRLEDARRRLWRSASSILAECGDRGGHPGVEKGSPRNATYVR
jgi:energy-coupling factor transporter ATP-binding protein EcfA2